MTLNHQVKSTWHPYLKISPVGLFLCMILGLIPLLERSFKMFPQDKKSSNITKLLYMAQEIMLIWCRNVLVFTLTFNWALFFSIIYFLHSSDLLNFSTWNKSQVSDMPEVTFDHIIRTDFFEHDKFRRIWKHLLFRRMSSCLQNW